MEVGTTPLRWNLIKKDPDERERRFAKMKVAFVEYGAKTSPAVDIIEDVAKLKEVLHGLSHEEGKPLPLRLFVVEDLSQQVIELLGARFDIDPLFFREQIEDYVWHNLGAAAAMPPPLMSDMKNRSWFRVRNFRLRHHESADDFASATAESETWNVARRLDDDNNHWRWAGEDSEIVSMLRTRTTIWVGKDSACGDAPVGVVLLDPTVRSGKPLWHDRANWLPVPSMKSPPNPSDVAPHVKPSVSWHADIVQLTRLFPWFEAPLDHPHEVDAQVFAKPALYTVCAEWLLVCEYVKGRLSQIERELELPEVFLNRGDTIDRSLTRLHTWRRAVPIFIEMVTETLNFGLPAAARLTSPLQRSNTGGFAARSADPLAGYDDIAPDFERVRTILLELQERVDRLSDVVASEISIEDSRRGLEDSRRANTEAHNMARVTWLATVFIPATFVSGLYSMNESVSELKQTYWIYFVTAVPVTLTIMAIAWVVGGGSLTPWKVSKHDGGWKKEKKDEKIKKR